MGGNRNKYDMDPEYLMDDDQPKITKRTVEKKSSYGNTMKLGAGETLVRKNPDGTVIVKKADGTMVKRKSVVAAKPSTSTSRPSTVRPSTARTTSPSARTSAPVTKPSTSRAAATEIKVGPGETLVKKNPDGSIVVRKADGKMVKRSGSPSQGGTISRRGAEAKRDREMSGRSRNSKYVNKRPSEKTAKKKLPIFWIGLGIWAFILLIFGIYMLNYTDKCLEKYEKSQADVAMKDFMADFEKKVQNKTIGDYIELPNATGVFEDASIIKNMFLEQFDGYTSITYEKDSKSYDTSAPFYNIYVHKSGDTDSKGTKVARMTLSSKNSKKVFAILQLVDWSVSKIEPALTINTYNYTISVPNDFTVKVNGVQLTDEYLTGEATVDDAFKNVLQYVDMPSTIQYKIEGLINKPDIKIYDATNTEVSYTPDDKGNIFVAYSAADSSAELTDEVKDYALKVAEKWEDFVTNDLSGGLNGFESMKEYLIEGSVYYEYAKAYASGPDITFISNHTNKNPKMTEIVTDKYIKYTDNCYSIHIKFVKNMTITRTGENFTQTFDKTIYFVKLDGKWLVADMVQTTKN